jgi:hypothetical protein
LGAAEADCGRERTWLGGGGRHFSWLYRMGAGVALAKKKDKKKKKEKKGAPWTCRWRPSADQLGSADLLVETQRRSARQRSRRALFRLCFAVAVTLLFIFNNYYLIINKLDLKDLSYKL